MSARWEVWDQSRNRAPELIATTATRAKALAILAERRVLLADLHGLCLSDLLIDVYLVHREEEC